jgi:Ser-tRNA(Ala) deacylase AlaX
MTATVAIFGEDAYRRQCTATAPPEPGADVEASIDWDRRYAHMRMHSCLHLPGAVLRDVIEKILTHLDKKITEPKGPWPPPCRAPPQRGLFDRPG